MGRKGVPAGSLVRDEAGAETVISTVLLLGIMISITGTMLAWAIPQLQTNESIASYNATYYHLEAFDGELEAVITQGEGASRTSGVSISAGTFTIHGAPIDWMLVWTHTTTAELAVRDVEAGSREMTFFDLKRDSASPDETWKVQVTWLADGHTNTSGLVRGGATFDRNLTPPLRGEVLNGRGERVGGFLWLDPDTLRWRHISPGGNYGLQLTNGAILAQEPGLNSRVVNAPLMVNRVSDDKYRSMVWNMVYYNTSRSDFHTAGASDFTIATTNYGSKITSIESIYSLKVQFYGKGAIAWRTYFVAELGFTSAADVNYEQGLTQDDPFRLDLVETEVGINLRTR